MMIRALTTSLAILLAALSTARAEDRESKVRNDRKSVEAEGHWIYNDLARGMAEAKTAHKPLLVVFRCVPCEACAQLDAEVVARDRAIRSYLEGFVCVRIVHANGMDLSLFQFDYDQSFAAFMLNADGTIYGRFGTRSHQRESAQDVSVEGFAKALAGALQLHDEYPANKALLQGKRGPAAPFKAPEEFPSLRGKYGPKLDYEGQVVKSCIHCHQVGEAQRLVYRAAKKPIPDEVLYPWPMPGVLGLVMDPKEKATVKSVAAGSSAEKDGFRPGDEIATIEDQPILSIADIQWALHRAGDAETLRTLVLRKGRKRPLDLTLEAGWRRRGDISWRASTWDLRRMATGGLVLEDLPADARREAGLSEDALALRVKHVGQYGEHAAGKNAGFQKDDILVNIDGHTSRMTETDLLAYALNERQPGDIMQITVLRGAEQVALKLPVK